MCLAIAYRDQAVMQKIICENISHIELKKDSVVLTDVLNRKHEIEGKVTSIDLTEGVIIIV